MAILMGKTTINHYRFRGIPHSQIQTQHSMDWFKGNFTGKPHNSWENWWFRFTFFLTPIHWNNRWCTLRLTAFNLCSLRSNALGGYARNTSLEMHHSFEVVNSYTIVNYHTAYIYIYTYIHTYRIYIYIYVYYNHPQYR